MPEPNPTKDWTPTDDELLKFDQGLLPESQAGAVTRWLAAVPGAEDRRRQIIEARDDPVAAALQKPVEKDKESQRVAQLQAGNTERVPTSAEASGSPKPDTIRDYQLVKPLGRGGMGEVYLARHMRLQRNVAIKILPAELAADPRYRARFERETAALGRMDHANLVRAFDAGADPPRLFLVMELLEGKDLYAVITDRGPLPVADACEAIRQASLGLHYAHQAGMVHRDIKPSNLFLTTSGVVKVIDLGLARLADSDFNQISTKRTLLGTPDFMAPEQWDNSTIDHRTDIYGLGCTLFYLLTGGAPYSADGEAGMLAIIDSHRQAPPPSICERRPEAPAGLERLLKRMLAKKADDRPATAEEVAGELAELAEDQNLIGLLGVTGQRVAVPQMPSTKRRRRAQRRRVLLMTAGALVAAVGLVGVTWSLARWSTPAVTESALASRPANSTSPTAATAGSATLHPSRTLGPFQAGVMTVAYSPDGKVLASGGQERSILLWDTTTWTSRGPLGKFGGDVVSFSFSPDGMRLASVTSAADSSAIRLWDVANAELAKVLGGPNPGMWGVAYSPDGRTVACGGWDRAVHLFDVASGEEERAIPNVVSKYLRALAISPDGKLIATGGSGPTRLWDAATGQEVVPQHTLPAELCPSFLPPKGDLLAGWSYAAGRVIVCEIPDGQVRATWRAQPGYIEGLAVSPDGRFIASLGREGAVHLWSVADQTKVATLQGHNGTVYFAAFAPDGKHLATAGLDDFTIRLWDLPPICHVQK